MANIYDVFERYRAYAIHLKGLSERTLVGYYGVIRRFVNLTGYTEVEALTKRNIEDWIMQGRLEYKWSAKTVVNALRTLSSFTKWCVEQNYLLEVPTEGIPIPKIPKEIPKHLNKDDAMYLLEFTQSFPFDYQFEKYRAIAIIATFMFTGIRSSELRNLYLSHVNLEEKTLVVRSGKGAKDRLIPIHPRLIIYLKNYLKERKRLNKTCPYFFTSMTCNARMGDKVIQRLVKRLRDASGIYFYPHKLRHSFATLMLEGGVDIFSLSKMMGHTDIRTTTIYLSATVGHLKNQIVKHSLGF